MGMDVSLTPELERFAQSCVESGRYNDVSEVVRSGLRLLQDRQAELDAFIRSLDEAVAEGERDGFIPFEQVKAEALAIIERKRSQKE